MKDKKKEKKDKFVMDAEYGAGDVLARQQEMQSILPGFMTKYKGQILYSRQLPEIHAGKQKSSRKEK